MGIKVPRETDLVRVFLQYLDIRGIFAFRVNSGAMRATYKGQTRFFRFCSLVGVSDILGILPDGRFLSIEVKSEKGKLRPAQASFLERVRASGGLALVARSLQELEHLLREAGYPERPSS